MHRLTGGTRTVIIEYGFLDNVTDHNWYKNDSNFYKAAEAVIEAVCKEIGITYKAKGQVAKPSVPKGAPGKLYKVQAGAFKNKENAEKLHGKMENAGIDAFVLQENGLYKVQAGAYSVKDNAEVQLKKVSKLVGDGFIVETGSTSPAPQPKPAPKRKTVDELIAEVNAGKHGNGEARKKSLGSRYNEVQAEINRRAGAGTRKSVSQLVDEVERGLHGNGEARKKSLGSRYAEVQAEINRRYR